MKVKELKAQLESYQDDESILVLYWDKDFCTLHNEQELSTARWEAVVSQLENYQMLQIDEIGSIINDAVDELKLQEEEK